jgi:hypothetical protein
LTFLSERYTDLTVLEGNTTGSRSREHVLSREHAWLANRGSGKEDETPWFV